MKLLPLVLMLLLVLSGCSIPEGTLVEREAKFFQHFTKKCPETNGLGGFYIPYWVSVSSTESVKVWRLEKCE